MGKINKEAVLNTVKGTLKTKAITTVLNPLVELVDENIADVTTTIGSFVIRKIRGKFQRSITFTIGERYADGWMEEALYGILYQYNNIKNNSRLQLTNKSKLRDGTGLYYKLADGTHSLKYRNYNILLCIQTKSTTSIAGGRVNPVTTYTIITYNLDPEFVKLFEKDMVINRNALLKIRSDSPTLNVYTDYHEGDGWTYWEKSLTINKRRLNTIYLPYEQKKKLVDTINNFYASKQFYIEHGIPWNLKILLYGEPGTGKTSIVKMIASEWNCNLYECTGGKGGKFIPNAISDDSEDVNYPVFSISDIDKYPFLINEPKVELDKESAKDDKMNYKLSFGAMINALDGVTSGEGRIIIMTTNHIEEFSEAFLRPGRIDLLMEIKPVGEEEFRKYVWDFYDKELPKDIKLKEKHLKIAELNADVVFRKLSYEEFIKKHVK